LRILCRRDSVLEKVKRWFRAPSRGDEPRSSAENTDAWAAATTGSRHEAGQQEHGNIPPNYVPPADEGRPRH